jgi:transposase
MSERLTSEEVAIVIRGRKILRDKGLSRGADVKSICEAAGISRKTGYQWANKVEPIAYEQDRELREEFALLKRAHEELKRCYDDVRFENEGRKLAWKIHGVDELLASKKNTIRFQRNLKR